MGLADDKNQLLTTKDIARWLRCSLRVAREIVLREIPYQRLGRNQVTGRIRVTKDDFDT